MPFLGKTSSLAAGVRYGDDSGVDEDDVIHIGRIDFRNDGRVFGIKDEGRFLHVYVIGKTGTGKSTLIETMALQDLERGNGFALIDPHGDLVSRIAAARPLSHYFRPAVRWRARRFRGPASTPWRWARDCPQCPFFGSTSMQAV
jgi:DNA helicase HerA-like ATPase